MRPFLLFLLILAFIVVIAFGVTIQIIIEKQISNSQTQAAEIGILAVNVEEFLQQRAANIPTGNNQSGATGGGDSTGPVGPMGPAGMTGSDGPASTVTGAVGRLGRAAGVGPTGAAATGIAPTGPTGKSQTGPAYFLNTSLPFIWTNTNPPTTGGAAIFLSQGGMSAGFTLAEGEIGLYVTGGVRIDSAINGLPTTAFADGATITGGRLESVFGYQAAFSYVAMNSTDLPITPAIVNYSPFDSVLQSLGWFGDGNGLFTLDSSTSGENNGNLTLVTWQLLLTAPITTGLVATWLEGGDNTSIAYGFTTLAPGSVQLSGSCYLPSVQSGNVSFKVAIFSSDEPITISKDDPNNTRTELIIGTTFMAFQSS